MESVKGFASKVNSEISSYFNKLVISKKSRITSDIKMFVEKQLLVQPEIKALIGDAGPNSLNAMLGISLSQATIAVNEIIGVISRSVRVDIKKFDKRLNGGVDLVFYDINLDEVTSLPSGSIEIIGGQLNWVNWLLTQGDTPVVLGFRYVASSRGRTGGGIMQPGGSFRIPPAYSGTEGDNFITRALIGEQQTKEITKIINKVLF